VVLSFSFVPRKTSIIVCMYLIIHNLLIYELKALGSRGLGVRLNLIPAVGFLFLFFDDNLFLRFRDIDQLYLCRRGFRFLNEFA
jgi:hypothetical protein